MKTLSPAFKKTPVLDSIFEGISTMTEGIAHVVLCMGRILSFGPPSGYAFMQKKQDSDEDDSRKYLDSYDYECLMKDSKCLASDWAKIGQDLKIAMKKYEKGQR